MPKVGNFSIMGNAYSTIHKASARHYPPHRVARQMLLTKENKAAQTIVERRRIGLSSQNSKNEL